MPAYDFGGIESKWQQYWRDNQTFRQPNPGDEGFQPDKPKFYVLDMFPYPSGAGLHVGHPEGYTATDIVARYKRMKGYNVLHPMGYDSFGLPAEQYAVEHGVHPRVTTAKNIENIERQIKMFGFSYDWNRRLATTDVSYYRWTQWIFLQLYNSWYDPAANAARPVSELVEKLAGSQWAVDAEGCIAPADGMRGNIRKWDSLSPKEQSALIDSHRLAYIDEVPVNWCPKLGTVLANEEVTNEGKSDRGNHPVYRRALKQWMLRITTYAQRLLDDLEKVNWPEPIKLMQRNWIGKSSGAEVDFPLQEIASEDWFAQRRGKPFGEPLEGVIRVYTTRPDTLFGATYMVLAPEHPLVGRIVTPQQRQAVEAYVNQAVNKSEMERTAESKDKSGMFTGAYAVNPVTRKPIPIWVADYVMMGYGTGAIMAVPAHDTRDMEFALKFNLPVIQVVEPPRGQDWKGYVDDGIAVNSGQYDGMTTADFKKKITEDLAAVGLARSATNYKLRDWLFSRQRYWGEPFPTIHCTKCGTVALSEDELPLELPEMEDFTPAASDDPEALPQPPLGKVREWSSTTCPSCGGPATRELNTMPQWAGSCWYYLRYLDPRNESSFCDGKIERYWMQASAENPSGGVDLYVGGAEHAVLHLLYSRFWHKVLFDLGYVSTSEPFGKLFNQGMIRSFAYRDSRGVPVGYDDVDLSGDVPRHKKTGETLTETIEKMSKSLKNVVNPDEVISQYGADTFRLYEMFMGPLEASKPWNTRDVPGVHRFLNRVWRMICGDEDQARLLADEDHEDLDKPLHKLIRKVGEDIEAMKFNTPLAAMMEFVNIVYRSGRIGVSQARQFILLLAPFAPHICEELWQQMGGKETLAYEAWPEFEADKVVDDSVQVAVQVNGKLRARICIPAGATAEQTIAAAMADAKVASDVAGRKIVKEIIVPGKLVNLVVK
ncbi:MAG: leucine--tRNA ligase [Planctomycetes bacterium]|jgi:leucyl-tRNA synthetase|nr:leucine--tRNA ligase [Planctomycetota bacterium]